MAEFAFVLFVKQKQELTNVAENTGFSKLKSNESDPHNVTEALRTPSMVEPTRTNGVDQQEGNGEGTSKMSFWSKKCAIIYGLPLTTKIDLVGFIVFHLSYLFFNSMYWPRTLHVSGKYE